MMKKWISLLLVGLMLLGAAPVAMADPEITEDSVAIIVNCKNSANVREFATSDSKKLGEAPRGKVFKLLAKDGDWYKIQFTSSKTGFVYKKFVKVAKKSDLPTGKTATVTNAPNGVNIRAKASSKSKKLGTLKRGEEVSVTAISGKWSQISYKGDVAYVLSKYISATKPDGDIIGKDATIVNCKVCVNVRAKASSHSTKLGTADLGTTWKVLGRSGNWIKVDYNGEPGFIYKKYVKIG